MKKNLPLLIAGSLLLQSAYGEFVFFDEDFESAEVPTNPGSDQLLYPDEDGLIVGANVFSPENEYLGGYFENGGVPFPAPNNAFGVEMDVAAGAFCNIAVEEGGEAQGAQVLAVYNDYNNADAQVLGQLLDANVFLEFELTAEDLGTTVTFVFDAKIGNLDLTPLTGVPADSAPPFTPEAEAFVKVLNPFAGYVTDIADVEDASLFPTTWGTYTLSIDIPNDEDWIGRLLQAGFRNKTSQYQASGVFYDNILLTSDRVVVVEALPKIVSTSKVGAEFFVTVESKTGFDYYLYKGASITGPYDEEVDRLEGTGADLILSDVNAQGTTGFYRVSEEAFE